MCGKMVKYSSLHLLEVLPLSSFAALVEMFRTFLCVGQTFCKLNRKGDLDLYIEYNLLY